MKEYILDTFKIGMSEKEAEKYFSKEIKKMNITERKIYLKNERKYFKFFKILLKRNRKFIIKIREYFEYEISNLFKKEQKILKKEIININKFNFKFKNMHLKNRKYLEIFLKISYRDAFGYQGMYTIYFPKDKIYINAITDYQFIIIFINNNKEAHGKDALEGRQDKKVAEDKSNDEEGLETLGRPANEYVKKKFGEDNNSKIKLTTDGIDLSNADVGEKVGDSKGIAKIKGLAMGPNETLKFLSMNKKIIENMNEAPTVSDYKNGEAMVKIFEGQENVINKTLAEENYNISSEKVHKELIKLGQIGGQNIIKNKYEGIYVLENEDIRKQFFDKGGNLRLDKFDPKNLRKIENSKKFKEGVEEVRKKSQEYYLKNKNIIKTEAIAKINTVVKLAGDTDIFTDNDLKFALGKTTITSRIIIDRGVPYLRYNITDKFQDPADINIEWGKQYQMLGSSRIIPLFDVMGLEK